MIRGIEGRQIFLNDGDRADMISRLGRLLPETKTASFAWALLPNHAHILLRTGAASLSTLMRRLLTGYVVNFNRRHNCQGPLFQNRYKSIVCQEDVYLMELIRYIHLNPLRAGLVRGLEDLRRYRYCGHRALLGEEKRPWQDVEYTLGCFGATADRARRAYLDYMKAGLKQGRRDDLTGGGLVRSLGGWMAVKRLGSGRSHIMSDQRILGSSDFVESVLFRADESYERRCELERMGFDLDRIAERVGELYGLDKKQVLARFVFAPSYRV